MPHLIADQFDDSEMEQIKRYGAAQLSGTKFSDEVEKHLRKLARKRKQNSKLMQAAQTSGGTGLAPTQIEGQKAV